MKKLVVIITIILSMIANGKIDIYPETAKIVEIENDNVVVETATGNLFSFTGTEDYEVNDTVSMIMYGNNTENVEDDSIIKVQYSAF